MLTNLIQIVELFGCIKRTKLRREGDIHQSWMYSMILIAVVHIVVEILIQRLGLHFAISIGNGNDLVLRKLHSTSLVHIDVA